MNIKFRHITLIALLAACLVSCGHDDTTVEGAEPVPVPEINNAIAFGGNLQEETTVTRAGTPMYQYSQSFKVYGFKNMGVNDNLTPNVLEDDDYSAPQIVFPGYIVNWKENTAGTTTTNSNDWEYVDQEPPGKEKQTVKYWDDNASAYRFFGVAGATFTEEVTGKYLPDENNPEKYEVTYEADAFDESKVPYYSKLWFSNGNTSLGQKPFGKPVLLEFIKPLSKVKFIFIFERQYLAPTTKLTEKNFAPTNGMPIKMKGDVTVTYPLTGTGTTETFSASPKLKDEGITAFTQDYYETVSPADGTVTSPYLDADRTSLKKEYTVLPVVNQGTYTLKVYVNGEEKTAIVPAEYMDWRPGYTYTYIFKVHIDETVTINDVQSAFTQWVSHETDYPVYNW